MTKFRMVQYGCGKMSKYIVRYACEKGVKIIGAFDMDTNKIGKDLGEISGMKKMGVQVQDPKEFDGFLKSHKPDVVVVTTMSYLKDVADSLLICAENGINAITTSEESFYPQNSNPVMFDKIDRIAKRTDCTISGSGYQDVFWGNLITVLAGATHSIKKIKGKSSYNVEDYGIALTRAHGAGAESKSQFEKEIASADNITAEERAKLIKEGDFLPVYMWNVNGWLADNFGWTVLSQTQKCIPCFANADINSDTLKMKIKKGGITGMSAVVTTKTKEGVEIESECIGKVYAPGEEDFNEWTIYGEPTTTVVINRPQTVELTCATIVNRIPEIVNAKSGFSTTEHMIPNNFKSSL